MRRLPLVMALLAGCCLVASGFLYLNEHPPAERPPFTVEPTEFILDVPEGEHEVVVRFTNPADRRRQIIGLKEG